LKILKGGFFLRKKPLGAQVSVKTKIENAVGGWRREEERAGPNSKKRNRNGYSRVAIPFDSKAPFNED
jgi:hypothetical protein